jgi:hypothetical protein
MENGDILIKKEKKLSLVPLRVQDTFQKDWLQ